MSRRKLAQQTLGLSWAVPQVIAHRVGRMATAGASPSARDRKEFKQMGAEKVAAFYESWAAMGATTLKAQQSMWLQMMRGVVIAPWSAAARPASLLPTPAAVTAHAMRVMSQGLAPVQRRASANAKRLGRVKSGR